MTASAVILGQKMGRFFGNFTADNVAEAVKRAVSEDRFTAHMTKCEKDKEELKKEILAAREENKTGLQALKDEQIVLHGQNTMTLDGINNRTKRLEWIYYLAAALVTVIAILSSDTGQRAARYFLGDAQHETVVHMPAPVHRGR